MSDEALAFNINYPVVETGCAEAGCDGCRAVHRRHTGDATLTVVGTIQAIQQIASEIIPGWPVNPGSTATLTSAELDAVEPGFTVMAGGFADGARNERHEWWKLDTGRWDSRSTYACRTNGEPGVSSAWLANNRQPKRLT